jgi:hemerythrin superfamily protein
MAQPINRKEGSDVMDALALLRADHNRVRGLFARFDKAKDADRDKEMVTLAQDIIDELGVHTTIEEEIFYPAVHSLSDALADTVEEGIQEHHVVKVLIDEVGHDVKAGSAEWTAKMTVLIENVSHHAEEEEKEMFPKVRSATDAAWLTDMAEKLEAKKRALHVPTLADKVTLSSVELTKLAKEQQIPGRSSMDHEELAATVAP